MNPLQQYMVDIDQEAAFQSQVLDLARLLGWLVYHTHDSRRSEPGFPDLVMVRDRTIFAELKSATGKLSPDQVKWFNALRLAGAEVYLWRPSDMQSIARILSSRRST